MDNGADFGKFKHSLKCIGVNYDQLREETFAARDAIWYGHFFDDDRIRVAGVVVTAEQSVADKAVWLASKALAAAGEETGRLELTTTCPHLDGEQLAAAGARLGVAVDVVVDQGDDRAVVMATSVGEITTSKSWCSL